MQMSSRIQRWIESLCMMRVDTHDFAISVRFMCLHLDANTAESTVCLCIMENLHQCGRNNKTQHRSAVVAVLKTAG